MTAMNRHILVAPHFPDGEIVNAFLTRILSYGGDYSLSLACRQLLKRRPSVDGMPNYLGLFHQELGHLYGDIDMLIDKHTEFNFFCCGLPRTKFSTQRERLIETFSGPVRLCRLPLLFSVSEQSYLQCSVCAEIQKSEFGFSFIHRRMGAPFVNICSIHGIPLYPNKGQLLLFDSHCQSKPNNYQVIKTMELGRRIEYCMETSVYSSKYQKENVIEMLKLSGWIGDNGRCHIGEFTKNFSKYFEGAFSDERLKILCQSEKYIEVAIRALLRNEKSLHPEWCVLISWFAESNYFNISIRKSNSIEIKHSKIASPKSVPLREELEASLAENRTLRAAAKAMGISFTLLSALCKRYEIPVCWRPKRLAGDLSTHIKNALLDGITPADVANKFHISLASVYRLRAVLKDAPLHREKKLNERIESDKAEWIRVVMENPGLSRSDLKKKYSNLWMRLYRNSNDWFMENQPVQQKKGNGVRATPPRKLLYNLDEALAEASDFCTLPDSKRINKSQYRLQNLTKIAIYALKRCEEKSFVKNYEEKRDEFVRARLTLAVKRSGRPSCIAREVGLREETIRKALKKNKLDCEK